MKNMKNLFVPPKTSTPARLHVQVAKVDISQSTSFQFMRYLVVGGGAFAVDFGLLFILTEKVQLNYLVSATASFLVGVAVNYIGSVLWVFSSRKLKSVKIELILFVIISGIGLLLNIGLIWVLTEVLGMMYLVSKLISAVIVVVWNFVGRKLILFR